jgi:hypothetical protein
MKQNNIRPFLVMRQGRLGGIVSDGEWKAARPSKATTLDIPD